MLVSDFDFDLPASAIAQEAAPRGTSRLLRLDSTAPASPREHRRPARDPAAGRPADSQRHPGDSGATLRPPDSRRRSERRGRRADAGGGGRVELLLVEKLAPRRWHCLAKPGRKARVGTRLQLGPEVEALVVAKEEDGRHTLDFSVEIEPHLEALGHVPLPPYIARADRPEDRARYQTVWAREPGAIAAPTAGLHFSQELLQRLDARGVERAFVTLHVGIGTFKPVTAELVHEHRMERERYEIPPATAAAIVRARREGRRIVAVGTTVVRTLESAALTPEGMAAGAGTTAIFITPGFPLPGRRRPAHQLPPAALDPAHAGLGLRRPRAGAGRLRRRDRPRLPLLLLRRRHARRAPAQFLGWGRLRARRFRRLGDPARHHRGAEAVVDVDHGDTRRARVEHREERR